MAGYETGKKTDVIAYMVDCAIRDRATYIDAYSVTEDCSPLSEEAKAVIVETKAEIRDFRKLKKALLNVF
jgi:hypothetical protein